MSDAAEGDLIGELEASAGWHVWKGRATGSSWASPAAGHHRALTSADSVENLRAKMTGGDVVRVAIALAAAVAIGAVAWPAIYALPGWVELRRRNS